MKAGADLGRRAVGPGRIPSATLTSDAGKRLTDAVAALKTALAAS
ncbi:MAG TPA: hypothetical protein VF494_09390 [Candidatus Limnocylindrales bacterium]